MPANTPVNRAFENVVRYEEEFITLCLLIKNEVSGFKNRSFWREYKTLPLQCFDAQNYDFLTNNLTNAIF
jgi:hypothetical protein